MRFLVDAQLPMRLTELLQALGHDAIHVSSLPSGNRTTDIEITRFADEQERVVVTKDRDFRDSHLLAGSPASLLLVTTGNITNARLLALFDKHIADITSALTQALFVEISHDRIVFHIRQSDE